VALVRPPGHHAEADRSMGFCLLNNIAIAAAMARQEGASRVAVLDWDVHHGNGTQHIFAADPDVLYASVHQYPYYPGTGGPTEIGHGPGAGATVNVGLPAGAGDAELGAAFARVLAPAIRLFHPDILLVSAGFDAYAGDMLAGMRVSRAGFRALARASVALADELCDGRIACVLEGGYELGGLADGVVALVRALDPEGPRGERRRPALVTQPPPIAPAARVAIDATVRALARAGVSLEGYS
jgi:acetoin utilization deacetylase AcuC-like enzyme